MTWPLWTIWRLGESGWTQVGAVQAKDEHRAVAYGLRAFEGPTYVHRAGTPFTPVGYDDESQGSTQAAG